MMATRKTESSLLPDNLQAETSCDEKGIAIVAAAIFCKKSRREFINGVFDNEKI